MQITKIESQKNPDRVNVYIDGSFSFGLYNELRYKYDLHKGKEIDKEFIEFILEKENLNKAINVALDYLTYRQRSEKEVFDKLNSKEYPDKLIYEAIDYLKSKGYINDREFARSFLQDKTNINKYGPIKIKNQLRLKGISNRIIDEIVDMDRDDEYQMSLELASKRISRYKNEERSAIYRKLGGYLQRRGFSYEVVNQVLRELVD